MRMSQLQKEDSECNLDADLDNLEMAKLDEKTFKLLAECCKEHSEPSCEHFEPRTLQEMGHIVDGKLYDCYLCCDQVSVKISLRELVENRQHTDVCINVQGQLFRCHLAVLQISTEYFKQFKSTDYIAINAKDVTAEGFEQAYDWMTKQYSVPQRTHLVQLYLTARFLNMPDLINQLLYCFQHTDCCSEGQAFKLFIQALPYKTSTLQTLLLTRISRFFLSAVATTEFLQLPPLNVYALLNSSIVSVNSEIEILMSALRWLMYDCEARRAHIPLLMKAVRFNLLPPWYIVSLKGQQKQPELKELFKNTTVKSMIDRGLSYSITQHFMNDEPTLQQSLYMAKSTERNWIIDEQASHHHLYKCCNWQYLDLNQFNNYLQQIINAGPLFYTSLKLYKISNLKHCCQSLVPNI